MANYEVTGKYTTDIRKLEPTDPAAAEVFNTILELLYNNSAAVKKLAELPITAERMSGTTNLLDLSKCTQQVISADADSYGEILDDDNFVLTDYMPCVPGQTIWFPGGNRRRINYYDDKQKLIKTEIRGTYALPGNITAPDNAYYFRTSYGAAEYDGVAGWDSEHAMICVGCESYPDKYIQPGEVVLDWLFGNLKPHSITTDKLAPKAVTTAELADMAAGTGQIQDKSITMQKVADVITNYLDLRKCTQERLSHIDGTVTDDSDYFTSPYIEFPQDELFICPLGENRCICFYDADKQFLSAQTTSGWSDQHDTTAMPDDAKYLRVSYSTSGFDVWNPMLVNGSVYPDKYITPDRTTLSWLDSSPLQGKKLAVLGDSICALHKSYINTVAYQNNMDFDRAVHNQSVWGSPIARHTYTDKPESFLERFHALRDEIDYLVIHGGANDGFLGIPIGDLTALDDFSGNVDEYTFCGALESLFRQAQAKYSDAIIIFVLTYKLLNIPNQADYISAARRVCDKYSVPVLDLYGCSGINIGIPAMQKKYFMDDTHFNAWGHLRIAGMVERFLLDYSTPQPQCVDNTNLNDAVHIKWEFKNVIETPVNKPISMYVKQPTQLTLKSARGGYQINYNSPTNVTAIKALSLQTYYKTKNANNENVALDAPLGLNLGKWDYITNETSLTRYSSEMVDIKTSGNWYYVKTTDNFWIAKANLNDLGISDIHNPENDNEECPIMLGPHEMSMPTVPYAEFEDNTLLLSGGRDMIAVKDNYLYIKMPSTPPIGSISGTDVTDAVRNHLQGPFGFGFYRKANAVSHETIEPVAITAYPYTDYFLSTSLPPSVHGYLDFGVQVIPDMPRIMIDGKAYDASGTGIIDLTQAVKDMIAKYK